MKKIFYILSSLMMVFTACDPMEDVYEELDAQKDPYSKDVTLTLANTDYSGNNKYFMSEEAAAAAIPTLLNKKYPALENGSTAIVTYNLFKGSYTFRGNTVSNFQSYELTSSDYALGGTNFSNFDRWSQIETFLNAKYPVSELPQDKSPEGRLVTLTYTSYNGNTSPTSKTVTDSFYYIDGQWLDTYHVSNENYASVERNRNNAFTSSDEELLPVYFNKFLKESILNPKVNDVLYVRYSVRVSSSLTTNNVMAMKFDGSNWVKVTEGYTLTEESSLQFAKKKGAWVPDLTKKYTLVRADYDWISKQPSLGTSSQLSNLGSFGNFYQSSTSSQNYWSNDQIIVALSGLLKNKYPNEEVGQKFAVTYAYYAGGNKTNTVILIKRENGNWEIPNPDEL